MSDEFNNKDDEIVDSIPRNAKDINDSNSDIDSYGNSSYRNYNNNNGNFYNGRTKIIIENGPASPVVKIALALSIFSVLLFLFPTISFMLALLGGGLAIFAIGSNLNGRILAYITIAISIVGAILAGLSSILWAILSGLINLLF